MSAVDSKYRSQLEYRNDQLNPSPVKELMNVRKEILHSLWSDIDESWNDREDFMHLHFREGDLQQYKPISNETMRVFEIRWLDLRIQGLIEQREDVLQRLSNIVSELSKPTSNMTGSLHSTIQLQSLATQNILPSFKDRESLLRFMTEELQIYRTLTLYITEYIFTWSENSKKTYLWNPDSYNSNENGLGTLRTRQKPTLYGESVDYVYKMATDFVTLVRKNRRLQQIIHDLQYTVSPLCLPRYPKLYNEDSDIDVYQLARIPSSQFLAHASEKLESKLHALQAKQARNNRLHIHSSQYSERLSSPNPNYKPEDGLTPEQSPLVQENDAHTFITETENLEETAMIAEEAFDGDFETEIEFEQPLNDVKPTLSIHSLTQYLDLPPLLVQQNYQDRFKRHKRYTDPLLTVRHEDLMRETTNALGDNSSFTDTVPRLSNSLQGRKVKYNKFTDQVLNKKHSPTKRNTNIKLSSKRTHKLTKNSKSTRKITDVNVLTEFNPPNIARELKRCTNAQDKLIQHYRHELQLRRRKHIERM